MAAISHARMSVKSLFYDDYLLGATLFARTLSYDGH